jgi:hypothetical protein
MHRRILFVFFIFCSTISIGQLKHVGEPFNGIQRAKDESGNYWLVNKYDVKIASLDSISLNSQEILDALEGSSLKTNDKMLIKRIVLMYAQDADRKRELLNVAKTYPEADRVVSELCHKKLLLLYGKRKLKKILRRKE